MTPARLMLAGAATVAVLFWLQGTRSVWRAAGQDPKIGRFGRVALVVIWPLVLVFLMINAGVERLVDLTEWFEARLKRQREIRAEAKRVDDLWRGRERG